MKGIIVNYKLTVRNRNKQIIYSKLFCWTTKKLQPNENQIAEKGQKLYVYLKMSAHFCLEMSKTATLINIMSLPPSARTLFFSMCPSLFLVVSYG